MRGNGRTQKKRRTEPVRADVPAGGAQGGVHDLGHLAGASRPFCLCLDDESSNGVQYVFPLVSGLVDALGHVRTVDEGRRG